MIRRRKFCAWWLVEPSVCITPWGCVHAIDRCAGVDHHFHLFSWLCNLAACHRLSCKHIRHFQLCLQMWRVLLTQVNFFCKHEQNGLVSAGFALLVFRRALVSVKVWSTTVPTFTIVSSGVAAIHSWQVRDSWRFFWWCCIPFSCVEVPFLLNFTTFTVWSCFSNSFVCISLHSRVLPWGQISRGLLAELCAVGNLTYSSSR